MIRDYRNFYSDKSREIVEKKRAREIKVFGYTFDGDDGRTIIDPSDIMYKITEDMLEDSKDAR